jgi:general secretion pathway protein D
MARQTFGTRCLTALALCALLALSGCAGQLAYQEANSLARQDRPEEALRKYREAIDADPANPTYRVAWLNARDHAAARLVEQGDQLLAQDKPDPARGAYQRALVLDPGHERARAGLRAVEENTRRAGMLKEASAAVERKDYELARQRLTAILAEQPSNEAARTLMNEVSEKTAAPPPRATLAAAYRQPISIEFRDAPLKQIFDVLAQRAGLNFLFDKDVKLDQRTSIFLKNSTVEAAVYYLLLTNQLEQQVMDGNTVLIFPNAAAKVKDYQQMVVKTFFLANADAKTIANTFRGILKSRDVVVDEKLNMVILRDTPEAIKLATRLVALQDVPEPEVMLEVEVLEVKRSRLLELGVSLPSKLTFAPLQHADSTPVTVGEVTSATGGSTASPSTSTGVTIGSLRSLTRDTIGVTGVSASITANKTDGDSETLANPRIRVRNHEKAKIVIGDKIPTITTTISPGAVAGFAQESVNYIDVGLTLNVEPTIYLNNEVGIRVALQVSNLIGTITTKSGSTAYQIGTREATTLLQLKDGENQVLAGLINNQDRTDSSHVPLLGDLPIVGRLFGVRSNGHDKSEIVLSITPHLIRNIRRPAADMAEFDAGTDSSFRGRPDAPLPSAPQPSAPQPSAPQPAAPALPLSSPPDGSVPSQPVPAGRPAGPAQPAVTVTPIPAPEAQRQP